MRPGRPQSAASRSEICSTIVRRARSVVRHTIRVASSWDGETSYFLIFFLAWASVAFAWTLINLQS